MFKLDIAVDAALDTLAWTTPVPTEDGSDYLGYLGDMDAQWSPEARRVIQCDLEDFEYENRDDLAGIDPGQIGLNFILTRNQHGTGFWDRGLADRGDRLTQSAHAYGAIDAYIGEDGMIHVQ